ncbi:MAG: sodium:proton antiporter [Methanospirillaceae archaeon]|nr:sodium:proton antiporter [Methanospirillaceae archaeon]
MKQSNIVRITADIMFPFIMIFGAYVVLHGHLTPGGGFQGGAVMASGVVLLLIAHCDKDIKTLIPTQILKNVETFGLLLFGLSALAAVILGSGFFTNWLVNTGLLFGTPVEYGPNPGYLNTGGVIPVMNIAVGLEVLAALSVIAVIMFRSTEPDCGGEEQ